MTTVAQLIEVLRRMPQSAVVLMAGSHGDDDSMICHNTVRLGNAILTLGADVHKYETTEELYNILDDIRENIDDFLPGDAGTEDHKPVQTVTLNTISEFPTLAAFHAIPEAM